MVEPVSLAFACVTAFKEVFLLSKAIYRATKSVPYAREERRDLHVEFYHELLILRDFGQRFLLDAHNSPLDEVSGIYS